MAYSSGPRPRPPPQRGYDGPQPPHNSYSNPGYGPDRGGYGYGDFRGPRQRQPRYEDSYNPQEEYDGYNQNPWSNEREGYGGNYDGYGSNYPDHNDQVNGRYRSTLPNQTPKPNRDGRGGATGPGRPASGRRPPQPRPYDQAHKHDQSHHYLDQAGPQEWEDQNYHYPGNANKNQRSEYDSHWFQKDSEHTYSLPSRDRPPLQNQLSAASDDLPKYMNGHAHGFSSDVPQSRSGPGRQNGGSVNDGRERTGIPPSLAGSYAAQSPYAVPWGSHFPTSELKNTRHRAHAGSIGSHSSKERSSFEDGSVPYGSQPIRPKTAEGSRRPNVSPKSGGVQYAGYNNVNGNYNDIPGSLSAPPVKSLRRMDKGAPHPGPAWYERSRTMPAIISEPHQDSGLIPLDNLQEPAAVSGYYGSQGADWGPGRPRDASRSQCDNTRWGSKNAAKPVNTHDARQPHLLPESQGEIVNSYPHETPNPYAPYRKSSSPIQRSPSAGDGMPNSHMPSAGASRGQGLTIGDHLQPHPTRVQGHLAMSSQRHGYDQGNPPPDQYHPGDIPRSRSQPDFAGPPPSNGRQNNAFEHSGPRHAPYDRPATSAGARYRGHQPPIGPKAYPTRSGGPATSSQGRSDPFGPPPGGNFRPLDSNGGPNTQQNGPRPDPQDRRGPPLGQHGRPSDPMQPPGPWRSPPLNGRGPPDDRMQGPDSLRSPARQNRRPLPDRMQLAGIPSPQVANARSPGNPDQGPFTKPPGASHKRQLSLDKPLPNPDALPHHPAPVRPGLNGPQPSAPNARPAPVRQYKSAPADPVQQSTSQSLGDKRGSSQITSQELEHLRQKTVKNPNDSATQFLLAQKLVEAADVLVDERADPATKKRSRDRYQSDALKIIKKLSAVSYTEADFYYADCYSCGRLGLQPDIKEAFLLYQKAAKANHAQAAYRVAVCCELGQEDGGGTKRDAVKAMQWYRRAATLGDVAAMYKIGVILLKGLLGQPRNPQEGITFLKQAAERADKENPHALHELALLHEKPTGMDGIRQDEAYSRQLFIQAANLGYKFSQFRLGCAYEYGLVGCPVDPRQSIAWYSKAAVQDEHQSELALSGWYLTGAEGVLQQSDTEAYLWARKAAQAGLAKAEYAMGYFTEVGIGAPANLEDAKRWYWKSASQNFPKARDRLEDLRRGGGPKQKTRVSRTNMRKQSDGECIVM